MVQTEEQILIVYSAKGTPEALITKAVDAVTSYTLSVSNVISVVTKPIVFQVPSGSAPGATLGSELTKQLQNSIGAIVFLDDLRPNVAYELGFFHGQGKAVLLVTDKRVEQVWRSISDVAGCALLSLKRGPLDDGVHAYLDWTYDTLARIRQYPAPELPTRSQNMLGKLAKRARIPVTVYDGDFGEAMRIDTWGGVIFDVGYNLLPNAKFKIAIRAKFQESTYSIYFRVRFPDPLGNRRTIALGLTSNRAKTGFEANERNLPAQSLTRNWRMLTGSFTELLKLGNVLGVQRVEHLELIRVRAGGYRADPFEKVPPYELGYIEIIGVDH